MAIIKPFLCVRPNRQAAARVAALPYDVYNRKEAKDETDREPLSFLKIDRAETSFGDEVDVCDPRVYRKAKDLFEQMTADGTLLSDQEESYYIYELVMNGRSQTGIVACASIDDYVNNIIKKHENTREDKEQDRIRHVDALDAQTGPIFLAYRSDETINRVVALTKTAEPLYDFTAPDGIGHRVFKISDRQDLEDVRNAFSSIDSIYIADGHHRAASAVKVGLKRRSLNPGHTGQEEYNFFLSVLFPHDQLMIMDYNRAVRDLNGHSEPEFLQLVSEHFTVERRGTEPFKPRKKAEFGMCLNGFWYCLEAKNKLLAIADAVESLDVSLLQNYLLEPVLGICDPRIDKRIDFIGGIRGMEELERRTLEDMAVAFAMYPTSIEELFRVADNGKLMPPKSTWFEPKLRSGLFIHKLN